jgi:hypothetical protein
VLNTGGSSVFWGGLNDSAMLVKGGVYTIKAEITDNFGQVTSLIKVVQVVPGGAQQLLRIFNSAGETVREIPLAAVPGANRMNLPAESYALELDASGAVLNPLKIDVYGNSGWVSQAWDGLNDSGLPVNSGTYTVQLVSQEGGKSAVVTSRSITVLKAPETGSVLDTVIVAPNPAAASAHVQFFYDPSKLAGHELVARVYSLAGELISASSDPNHSGKVDLFAGRQLSSGIYLVRCELREGPALVKARVMKIAVVR